MRAGLTAAVAAALVAVASACVTEGSPRDLDVAGTTTSSTSSPSTTIPTTSTTQPTTARIALPAAAPIAWSPCGGGFECGRLAVPVDYTDPDGVRLELALTRRPAGDPGERIGSLVMNPGGPGASGVRRVQRGFTISDEVARRFDIIGFDPRGVGDSGRLECGGAVDAFRSHDLAPDDAAEAASLEAAARTVAEECQAAAGDLLGHFGTVDVARDVEMIRRSLGEQTISFVGLSYGTLIGLLWAEAYPSSVRALVLDGVVDPASQVDVGTNEQVKGVDRAFAAIDEACRSAGCPLAASGGVSAAYDLLAERLEVERVGGVGPTELAYAAIMATYGPSYWQQLWSALQRGLAGDTGGIAALAHQFRSLVDYVPFAVVSCLDAHHAIGMAAWTRRADVQAAASPRFGRVIANELLPCAFWPQATFVPHTVTAEGTPPVLVVGTTGDALTPYTQAERVARTLADGHLLTVDMEGHVAIGDSPCAEAAITRYLVDGTPPSSDC